MEESELVAPPLEAHCFDGAFGPSILLVLSSQEAVSRLGATFRDMAVAPVGRAVSLTAAMGSEFHDGVGDLVLARVVRKPGKSLVRKDSGFTWACTADEWITKSLLVDSLLEGPGHQYLTAEGLDDALIEVSHGERHVARG